MSPQFRGRGFQMAVPGPFFRNVVGTPASPQFAQFTLKGHTIETEGANRPSWNVFHFRKRPSGIGGNPFSLGSVYMGQIGASLSAALSIAYVSDIWECKMMDDPAFLPVSDINAIAASVTGDRMPSGNGCVTFRLKCNAAGRAFRGSKHFSPIAESQTTLDELNAGAIVLWLAVAAAMLASPLTDTDGNEWDLVVLSTDESDFSASPAVFTGAYVVNNPGNKQIGTMRRRRQRNGTTF